jgi:hypothetical protein
MNTPTVPPPFNLTAHELVVLQTLPGALDALIDWHEAQATLADGMDMPQCVDFHDGRKTAIRAEAARLAALDECSADHERMEGR